MLKNLFQAFRAPTRSLKATLAFYFLPLSVLPAIFLSLYATRIYEDNTREILRRRAETERDAFTAEIQRYEKDLLDASRDLRDSARLVGALASGNRSAATRVLAGLPDWISARIYSPEGKLLVSRLADWDKQISFLPESVLSKVKTRGEQRDRIFREEGANTVVRTVLKGRDRLVGVLEAQSQLGARQLADFKKRREVDCVLLNKDFSAGSASFALPAELTAGFSKLPFKLGAAPVEVTLGDTRFAAYLYEMPAAFAPQQKSGYFVLFLSMTAADATAAKLRVAMLYITAFLVLSVAFLIFLLSNRIVEPIELLVLGMKRIRNGRNEAIPLIDSPYEIEYLVHSFNEMAATIAEARQALELKVEELGRANSEIKEAQGVVVQSAKMASLGQLVAGVAHELNNPIGFISSNMHHLDEYVQKIQRLVNAYQKYRQNLPAASQADLEKLESELEIDYILKDMLELTRSCVEGANRTKDIVLGLRTFSRMDESTFRSADIHEGIRTTLRLLVTELKDRVAVHEEFGVIPEIECNLSQLNQVFMNLFSNAAQAINGRGDLWIRTRRDGERVRIEIEDNGAGMPPEVVSRIFDPFFTTKTVGKGTGLGLSIAYGLIERHGGQIEVHSELGRGTRFTILLPLRQPVQTSPQNRRQN